VLALTEGRYQVHHLGSLARKGIQEPLAVDPDQPRPLPAFRDEQDQARHAPHPIEADLLGLGRDGLTIRVQGKQEGQGIGPAMLHFSDEQLLGCA
jgi:hypothetical protein